MTNNLPENTSVHWHGLVLPFRMGGIPFIGQVPANPGETFVQKRSIREGNTGSHMDHSHHGSTL